MDEQQPLLGTGCNGCNGCKSKIQEFCVKWKRYLIAIAAALLTALAIVLAVVLTKDANSGSKKTNIIFMVSDGMGPASIAMARQFRQFSRGSEYAKVLHLDRYTVGSSRTHSNSSYITDSAAGATAFSCGVKSYNGAIGVDGNEIPCGTILEAAKLDGWMTGMVVTTRITDATPASFNSHVRQRFMEDEIALQQIGNGTLGRVTDLMLGGGACHFLPHSNIKSCRNDNIDVLKLAERNGFNVFTTNDEFSSLYNNNSAQLPLLGLVANTDIPFEIDRKNSEYPSLSQMVELAIKTLSKATEDSDKGFFLLIEGSRIDHAGHMNDPAAQVHEVIEYDRAFKYVANWLKSNSGIVVSTSDHETGGLTLGRQVGVNYPEYAWYPEVLLNARHSAEHFAARLRDQSGSKQIREFVKKQVKTSLGISDPTKKEIDQLVENRENAAPIIVGMVSERAKIGWTTHGHTGVDVPIFFSSTSHQSLVHKLVGNHENTDIGNCLASFMEADMEKVTNLLNSKKDF